MNITIAGGGNIGTQLAVHCAQKGHSVIIYTSKPDRFQQHLSIVNERGELLYEGDIHQAVSDEETAFKNADLILVTLPSYCMSEIAGKILPFLHKGTLIGLIPGTGGGECAFQKCLKQGAVLFGLQRAPSVARLVEYGRTVQAVGYRKELYVSAMPQEKTALCSALIGDLLGISCHALPCYLNLTLTPSNPILHTTRLRTLFQDYENGVTYDSVPLFYEDWDDKTSRLLFECDDEVQSICHALTEFDLSHVKSLKEHYESDTPEKLTKKISSIPGFQGLKTPMLEANGKYVPDFQSRYFVADFEYGLSILVQIGKLAHVSVPYMAATLEWYYKTVGYARGFRFSDYGISDYEKLVEYYSISA